MPQSTSLLSAVTLCLCLANPAAATCAGQNLMDSLPPERMSEIQAATDAVPFPTGNFWRATRGEEVITIAGTYHFDDPRHEPNLEALTPYLQAASTVLVEAGPEEQKALMDLIASDPSKLMITEGPTLYEQLPPELWDSLAKAMSDRGIPGFVAAKFRPWYVVAMLAIPPCAMAQMVDPKGLDGLIIDAATDAGTPVRGLEPFDTIFRIFDGMSEDELIGMLESTLLFEDRSEDYSATLADSYFSGQSRMIWEFMRFESYAMPGYTRAEIDAELARLEAVLMNERNRAWIPVLTEAAEQGPVFAAFGALHLSGNEGVLALLQDEGFSIQPLELN